MAPALSNVQLELPDGISQIAPARLDPIVAGSEVLVTGRLNNAQVTGDAVLRGTINGRPFEQRYALDVTASDSSGNAFVPRLFAGARIADLERDGSDGAKREAVALSTRHGVASRYTSLLVLESEAMYKAFGLDSAHKAPEYTADLDAEGTSASGELAQADEQEHARAKDDRDLSGADKPSDLAMRASPEHGAESRDERRPWRRHGRARSTEPVRGSERRCGVGQRRACNTPARKPAFAPPPAPRRRARCRSRCPSSRRSKRSAHKPGRRRRRDRAATASTPAHDDSDAAHLGAPRRHLQRSLRATSR